MGNSVNEVELIQFNSDIVRVPQDRPFVEYQIPSNDIPMVVHINDTLPMMQSDVYRAKIHTFSTTISSTCIFEPPNTTKQLIALDQNPQYIVDMFVKDKEREIESLKYQLAITNKRITLEQSKTCHDRFIDWLEKTRVIQWLRSH